MSLGRLTIDVNAHESGTARHGSLPDQITEGIHRPYSGEYPRLSRGRPGFNSRSESFAMRDMNFLCYCQILF
ncbi:hypothetical protein J3Q64DRAFT_1832372 [Phycomyces blakesleeanus]|uniref:Uncharacterized protein n=1 Tax=Phycomyces blakesleeanus TaxID=4837 RepID=A0ABR3B394_PHYBL